MIGSALMHYDLAPLPEIQNAILDGIQFGIKEAIREIGLTQEQIL